ncbi:hypothetical protein DFP72DRAFT_1050673 [Ephemerocybe angulata]|uniref:Uncharacterized protein n=1 Tax=Ephemerocybe angulata TaxID=980116 RepID=A0A8H6HHU1_9AGAR|nr:hypothetical protein DFP72DRAFT_1050673 [Tulosesus angulatus]
MRPPGCGGGAQGLIITLSTLQTPYYGWAEREHEPRINSPARRSSCEISARRGRRMPKLLYTDMIAKFPFELPPDRPSKHFFYPFFLTKMVVCCGPGVFLYNSYIEDWCNTPQFSCKFHKEKGEDEFGDTYPGLQLLFRRGFIDEGLFLDVVAARCRVEGVEGSAGWGLVLDRMIRVLAFAVDCEPNNGTLRSS